MASGVILVLVVKLLWAGGWAGGWTVVVVVEEEVEGAEKASRTDPLPSVAPRCEATLCRTCWQLKHHHCYVAVALGCKKK